jgi:hypothetical protein
MSTPYTSDVVARAREHHAAGWKPSEIRRLIESEVGQRPDWATVKAWVDPKAAEKRRQRTRKSQRALNARRGIRPFRAITPELRIERMRAMRDRGLSHFAIGQVAAVWWGDEMSDETVSKMLGGRPSRRVYRKRAAA